MSTYFPSGKDLAGKRKWFVVDAAGQTVGHLASEVASILTGKRNPAWTPFMDMGDHVIVINARQAVLKGAKAEQKMYRHHTRYPGGLRELGKAMAKKLKVYADGEHPHTAQRPEALTLTPRHKEKQA
jgi:large subunit ribosomal protein L13